MSEKTETCLRIVVFRIALDLKGAVSANKTVGVEVILAEQRLRRAHRRHFDARHSRRDLGVIEGCDIAIMIAQHQPGNIIYDIPWWLFFVMI